ncbi:MAG: protein tyrosine phosphatase family protein [Candidatus Acidiferrales bacterium]
MAQKIKLAGVSNFGKVSDSLYRGAQPSRQGFQNLASMGIQIVVDLRPGARSEKSIVEEAGLEYVSIPWTCRHPSDDRVAEFLELLRDNPGKKIFVHCYTGIDRTGMMIAAYRMAEQGWTAAEARREMNAFGYNLLHRNLCRSLIKYERNFPNELENNPRLGALAAHTSTP